MGKNKPKANANCNQVILDHFWNICDQSEEKRCRSIHVILQTLSQQVKANLSSDINYCVERLVRGLISTREFARHGFCVLLTRILAEFWEQCDLEDIFSLAQKEYGQSLANASSEGAISWSLLIGCILKSGKITTKDPLIGRLFDDMFQLGIKKNYVEIIICNLLPIYFDIFQNSPNEFKTVVLETTKNSDKENKKTIFFAYVILLAYQKFPSVSENYFNDFVSNLYKANSKDYNKVLSLFKESTKYHPNIHPINELVVQTIFKMDKDNFSNFCSAIVENIFKVNLEKTSLGFEIVRILLKLVNPEQVELVLSPNFMRLFIQTLSNKKHPLHNSASELGNYFVQFSSEQLKENSKFQVSFAKCFINKPGSINFDELSKSKILFSILKNFSNDSIRSWVLMLKEMMVNQDDIPTSDFYRIRCLQQISNLLKSYSTNDSFLWSMNKFLFVYAYFDVSSCKNITIDGKTNLNRFESPLSEKLQKQFPDSFKITFAHLGHLATTSVNSQQEKLLKQIEVLLSIVDFIETILNRKKIKLISSNITTIDNIKQIIVDVKEKIEQISSIKKQTIATNIFQMLYLYFLVELFENFEEIHTILPDFTECANRSLLVAKKSKKLKENKLSQSDEPLWADVLTDLFLSLLTSKSKYMKNIVLNAFKHISPFVTSVGMQSLFDAILNKDAFNAGDSDEEDDEEMEQEENELNQGANENESDQDDSEDDDDDDIEDTEVNEVDEQFKLDVIKALGSAVDQNNDNDDSDGLSDSEMFKIDDSLAEVFKRKFGEKKLENERQNSIQTFKHRVLELIQIAVESNEMSLELTLDVLSSILIVAKSHYALKNMSPLTNKCIHIFTLIAKKKFTNDDAINEEIVRKVLNQLVDFQYKCSHLELQKSLVSLSAWLLIVSKNRLPTLEMFQLVTERALKDFFERPNVELKSNLFIRLIPQLCEALGKSFLKSDYYETLLEYSFKPEVRSFKRCAAIEIICALLKSSENNTDKAILVGLGTQTISLLIDELGNLSAAKKDKQATSNQTKLQYINLLIRLIITCNVFDLKNTKIVALLKQLNPKLDSVPKEYRKKLDKTFIRKVRSALD